ncbi:MAG: NAD(P)(+) transhydrogenase (Re/Si-specific) subunit beta [Planctomycetes bacterium]|nr:NAD(P)(+) transhydrogenase (Re/Si-specific) subunit beta [Planctomycetota bacterium]
MNVPTELCYLAAAVLFMLSLKWLASPKTARLANFVSMAAMALAVIPTFVARVGGTIGDAPALANNLAIIGSGIALGSAIGLVSAYKVKMTAMPQMVGLYNGFGGAASLLVASVEYLHRTGHNPSGAVEPLSFGDGVPVHLSIIIGGVCFTGSMAAFCKLQEVVISGRPVLFRGQHMLNLLLLLTGVTLAVFLCLEPMTAWSLGAFLALAAASLLLGWLVVIPIGGADMPVVISLMNSYSGMAVTTTGFVLKNNVLIIVGSFVGASGIILTNIMCVAMNRSFFNVLFGGFGATGGAGAGPAGAQGAVKEASVEEAVEVMSSAGSLIVVPGYGMAVAQAQHAVRELASLLEGKGVKVRYAIHPVAGRMPGHMNVLLAEANVPYDQLFDLDQINDDFSSTDAVLVVGANDVVNPAAKKNPSSPIYGMPVFNCELARAVFVLKRSMNPGFAGIENELFVSPNTMMVFGDAKKTLQRMAAELKTE